MNSMRMFVPLIVSMVVCMFPTSADAGGDRWEDGRWRLELSGFTGIRSGHRSRTDDSNINVTIEYEVPINKGMTVGLRLQPLFYYYESESKNDIWGAGIGPMFRWYHKKEDYEGFFIDFGVSILGHSEKFNGNSGSFNFLNEVGFGYAFPKDWHVAFKWRHLSNAGLAEDNAGINGIGIAFGHRF